jgi:nucleoside-diphosphate-sugar epimerase
VAQCLVTGGSGFIGSHLIEGLLAAGHSVRVLDDLSTGNAANLQSIRDRIEFIKGSVVDRSAVRSAVANCQWIFHLAALPSVSRSVEEPLLVHEICATGTLNVLEAARHAGVRRLVYAASSSAYGDQEGAVRRETDMLMPLSPYAAAKLAGEHYCLCFTKVYGLETVRLRFFNVFGPRQDAKSPYSGVIALFIAAMTARKTPTIFGDGLQSRDFVYVANVVQALMKAATAPEATGQVYNIGMGASITVLDLVAALNELLGTRIEPRLEPPRPGDIRYSEANIIRARTDLGYDPQIPFKEGLKRTIAGV